MRNADCTPLDHEESSQDSAKAGQWCTGIEADGARLTGRRGTWSAGCPIRVSVGVGLSLRAIVYTLDDGILLVIVKRCAVKGSARGLDVQSTAHILQRRKRRTETCVSFSHEHCGRNCVLVKRSSKV